jgi:hypothetical protein
VLAWSLAVSVVVHLILLLLSPLLIQVGTPPGELASAGEEIPGRFGLEMIVPIVSETAPDQPVPQVDEPDPLVPAPTQTQPTQAPAPPGAQPGPAAPVDEAPPGSGTIQDALRPGFRDSRLYVTPRRFPELERSDHERYMDHLQARIDAINDSMSVAASRERRTADWTITDGDGNRWGLTPEGLHLGGFTVPSSLLPLPRATGDNQSLEADRERQRQREEIRRQEEAAERRRVQEERIDATRGSSGGSP